MDVAAGGGGGGIDVGVGVDPDEADSLIFGAEVLSYAGDGSGGDGVVATEDDGDFAEGEGIADECGVFGAGGGDFAEVLGVEVAGVHLLGDADGDVADVFDGVAEGGEAGVEAGDAHG